MGRPPGKNPPRTRINIMISPDVYLACQKLAALRGLSASRYLENLAIQDQRRFLRSINSAGKSDSEIYIRETMKSEAKSAEAVNSILEENDGQSD